MVGVAGRSKACHTCKRRRVACDKTHPACRRCLRARLECEGYERSMVLVIEDPSTKRQWWLEHRPEKRTVVQLASVTPLNSMSLSTVNDDVQLTCLMDGLFVTDERTPLMGRPFEPWLVASDPSSVASLATKALAAAFFGRRHNHQSSCVLAMTLYGATLQRLARDLSVPNMTPTIYHILASLNLSMYELIRSTSHSAWRKHANGIQQLICHQRSKPHLYQIDPAKSAFIRARSIIVIQALRDRQRTFLEEEAWLTIPWALNTGPKSSLDRIVDVMCFIPGILEDLDTLQITSLDGYQDYPLITSTSTSTPSLISIQFRIIELLYQLYTFRWEWEIANPSVCYETPAPDDCRLFPSVLHFVSLTRANEVTLYNATLLILLQLAEELNITVPDPASAVTSIGPMAPSKNPLRLPSLADSPRAAADEICRCATFHLADPKNMAGPFFLLFPLKVARTTYAPGGSEVLWIDGLMKHISEKSVFGAETTY